MEIHNAINTSLAQMNGRVQAAIDMGMNVFLLMALFLGLAIVAKVTLTLVMGRGN